VCHVAGYDLGDGLTAVGLVGRRAKFYCIYFNNKLGKVRVTIRLRLSPFTKSPATSTTFKAHPKTELFTAAYDTV